MEDESLDNSIRKAPIWNVPDGLKSLTRFDHFMDKSVWVKLRLPICFFMSSEVDCLAILDYKSIQSEEKFPVNRFLLFQILIKEEQIFVQDLHNNIKKLVDKVVLYVVLKCRYNYNYKAIMDKKKIFKMSRKLDFWDFATTKSCK